MARSMHSVGAHMPVHDAHVRDGAVLVRNLREQAVPVGPLTRLGVAQQQGRAGRPCARFNRWELTRMNCTDGSR